MPKRVKCPFCGSDNTRLLHKIYNYPSKFKERIYVCNNCLNQWNQDLRLREEKEKKVIES